MYLFLIIALRFIIPLLIFRWPVAGFILGFLADAVDYPLLKLIGWEDFEGYQQLDKLLDLYLLFVAMLASLKWDNKLAKNTSIFLFFHRTIGVILFEYLEYRPLLLFFPDLYSCFYFVYLSYKKFVNVDPVPNLKSLLAFLFMLLVPKLIHEYILHYAQLPWWDWFRF